MIIGLCLYGNAESTSGMWQVGRLGVVGKMGSKISFSRYHEHSSYRVHHKIQ